MVVLTLWEIDSFEGGKGSRADYLQKISYKMPEKCYVNVTSITAEAARENLKNGNIPDIISYGAGVYGLERYIKDYKTWCQGGYCILTLDENADFSDVSASNTVINTGIENRTDIAALLSGITGAATDRPTGAYVKLISGKYKYLLGTQRDIYRLKTRGLQFTVKPVTEFNDLYQNISITAQEPEKAAKAALFIEILLSERESISSLGLMKAGVKIYDDEMSGMEGLTYERKLCSPITEAYKTELDRAALQSDINLLKNLLK